MNARHLDRRGFIAAGAALAGMFGGSRPASAQPVARPARIGWLSSARYTETPQWPVFTGAMRALGWSEGEDYAVVHRPYESHPEHLPALVSELLAAKVDLIVAAGTPPAVAAKAATASVPIVFFGVGNPVGAGLAASLARPGGNATGTGGLVPGLLGKALQLLKEAAPKSARIGLLINPDFPGQTDALAQIEAAARQMQLALLPAQVRTDADIVPAFAQLAQARADALFVIPQPFLYAQASRIAQLAIDRRWPAASLPDDFAEGGALLAYGDRLADHVRRVPFFVDRILKGGKPADLPVEQSTRFYLTLNLKTARALGLALPQALLLRAERTIE